MPDLQPILEFDATDEAMDQIDGNVMFGDNNSGQRSDDNRSKRPKFKPTEAMVRKQAPTFLLIESLIWNFCCFHENDKQKQKTLFVKLCHRLQENQIIGTTYRSDSLHPIREFILIKFKELVSRIRDEDKHMNTLSLTSSLRANAIISSAHLIDQTSRYDKEFIDLGLIEEGGFGFVNKAKYRFDDCKYAVKMIRFKYKSDTDFKKITREVNLYANLSSHPNVVAYKTAWLENWCLHRQKIPLSKHMKTTSNNQMLTEIDSSDEELVRTSTNDENDVSILFEESSKSGIRIESSNQTMNESLETQPMDVIEDNEEEDDDEDSDDSNGDDSTEGIKLLSFNDLTTIGRTVSKRKKTYSLSSTASQSDSAIEYRNCYELQRFKHNIPDIKVDDYELNGCPFSCSEFGAILYIQMELCGKNLKTWLRERNHKVLNDKSEPKSEYILNENRIKESENIFRQILKGVEYIHSQHLIHRDLKPQNILFSIDGNEVKIGDFGLATLHNSIDNEEISLNYYKPNGKTQTKDNDHTGGIGTSIYAAPEQKVKLLNRNYDNKTDLFSLGIILFELFYPLSTDMEKVQCVSGLTKKRILPEMLQKYYPNVAKIILSLTHPNPVFRPNASQVLHSSLFLTEEQMNIKQIESKNKRLEELNKHLSEESIFKDNRIKELEKSLENELKVNIEKDLEIQKMRKQLEILSNKLKFFT